MQSGIREVLAYPTDENELREAIKRVEKRISTESKEKQINSKVISFISCKGGSGATFLATNFSYLLAEEFNQNTIFLDLDLQNGDAIYYVSPGTSKSDVIEITKQIDRLDDKLLASSVLHVSKNFDLLPSPEESDSINSMTPEALEKLINTSTKNYDIVVMDLERAMNTVTTQAIQMSNLVYIIMENLLPFIRDAKRLIQKLRDMGYSDQKIRLVVNRYENNGTIDIDQIESAVGIRVSHTIHSSFKEVAEAINTGVPIIKVNSNNTVVKNLRLMALEVTDGEKAKKTSWFNRLLGE
jgi:pilus assembly protein CpaE